MLTQGLIELAELLPEPVLLVSADGTVLAASRSAAELTGSSPTQLQGVALESFVSQHGLFACGTKPIVSTSGQTLGSVAIYSRNGPRTPSESERAIIEIAARLATTAIEQEQDKQELQRAKDAAEAANHAKDKFIAVLSHELRTPLSPALATLYALEQQSLPPDMREDISMVRRNLELESRLIDDLLDVTRITRGKLDVSLRPIDLHAKIKNVLRICEADAQSKGVILKTALCARYPRVMGDSARLQQVFWNLLRNAIKFTPAGGTITIRSRNAPNSNIIVDMIDTGMGIAPDVLGRIFEPFEQGDRVITQAFGGLGLGLAIARGIVDLHGGKLSAQSDGKGHGATFTVELATCGIIIEPEDLDPQITPLQPTIHGLRILLVEDHHDTARVMSRILSRAGHEVQVADTVGAAIRAHDAEFFDLVISDLGLPDGSGLDLIRQLRAHHPVRGIALSGFGMDEDIRKSREAGFDEHLTKPVHPQILKATIARVMCNNQRPASPLPASPLPAGRLPASV